MNQSMYSESQLMEVDMQLSKGQAMKVIKRFVQQGFQANLAKSGAVKKSAYGDAPDSADAPKAKASKQSDVAKALAFRSFWIVLHVVTCLMIVAGNGRTLGWW